MKKFISTRGNGKGFLIDYFYFLKLKRALYKHLKQVYKRITFEDYFELLDYLIEHYYH